MKDQNDFSPIELLISAFLVALIALIMSITAVGMISDHITLEDHLDSSQLEQNK